MKRTLVFSIHLEEEVLGAVPIRHWVFTIPKMLRPYFRRRRKLLAMLSRCAWECVKELHETISPQEGAVPGAVVAVHTSGDKLNFHPHLHMLASDGVFLPNGDFLLLPTEIHTETMEQLFQYKALSLLQREGKITSLMTEKLLSWQHSGFNCHCGGRIEADDKEARERLARYLIRAPLALERLNYAPEEGNLVYGSGY